MTMFNQTPEQMQKLVDKYRPKRFDDVKGQDHIISVLNEMIAKKDIEQPPNLLFYGPPGTGKTTLALIFADLYLEGLKRNINFFELNGSDSRKIDDMREKVKPLTKTIAKIVIFFTEADEITDAAQAALRRISEVSKNTLFIFDLNDESKFIDAMQSRCAGFRFKPLSEEVMINKLYDICEAEKVKLTYSPEENEGFRQVLKLSHGDLRRAINELSKLITSQKEINVQNVLQTVKASLIYESLQTALNGDFEKAKNIIEDAYLTSGNNVDLILDGLIDGVSKIENEDIRVRLFYELGELEHRLQSTHRPVIPLVSFISFVHICPHLKRN
jgi:replication factor C small subunit